MGSFCVKRGGFWKVFECDSLGWRIIIGFGFLHFYFEEKEKIRIIFLYCILIRNLAEYFLSLE